jgi:hypothetical protein
VVLVEPALRQQLLAQRSLMRVAGAALGTHLQVLLPAQEAQEAGGPEEQQVLEVPGQAIWVVVVVAAFLPLVGLAVLAL